jgi:hypothetical protein
MQSPYSNPYLSMRARGLFAYYAELGRVVSADELSAVMPEGRDSIQGAINELKANLYIKTTREWNGIKWFSTMKFTEGAKKLLSLNTGFSGLLYIDSDATTNTSTTTSNNPIVELLRSSTISRTASSRNERGNEMGWDLDGEQPKPKKRFRIDAEDDSSGAVGKVEDKKALRQAKYGAKDLESDPLQNRSNKPEADWSTKDLVAEFGALLNRSQARDVPMQLNTQHLSIWINKMVGEGVTRQQMLLAIRMFFEDPRHLNDPGIGVQIWRRFIAYYPTAHGLVTREELPTSYVDEEFKAQQDKMLRLLGGK